MSTIILQFGHYVHLPKFCAIWGKMSWGKMSLGHFVLGHFVSGAKCPWGKMSPSLFFIILSRHVKEFFLFDWIFFATSILKHPAWPVLDTSGGEKQVSGGYQRLVWWKRGQHLRFSRLKVFGIMKVLVVYFRFVVNLMNAMRLGALLAGWRSSRWL